MKNFLNAEKLKESFRAHLDTLTISTIQVNRFVLCCYPFLLFVCVLFVWGVFGWVPSLTWEVSEVRWCVLYFCFAKASLVVLGARSVRSSLWLSHGHVQAYHHLLRWISTRSKLSTVMKMTRNSVVSRMVVVSCVWLLST